MKKSFITIALAVTLVAGGTAIYSTQKSTNNSKNTTQTKNVMIQNKKTDTASNNSSTKKSTTEKKILTVSTQNQDIPTTVKETNSNIKQNSKTLQEDTNGQAEQIQKNPNKEVPKPNKQSTDIAPQKVITNNIKNLNESKNSIEPNIETSTKVSKAENIVSQNKKINTNIVTTRNVAAKNTNTKKNKIQSNLTNSQIYARLKSIINKTTKPGTAFVTNLNDYKIVNNKKYYNIYEYYIGNKSNDWIFKGNYSNFIGAKYMDINGDVLGMQFIQNFENKSINIQKSYIQDLANQFAQYFPSIGGNFSIDMNKSINFEGYKCYLVHFGTHNIYMTPAGFIYIDKENSFY